MDSQERGNDIRTASHRIAVARRPYDHVAWGPGLQKQRRAVPCRLVVACASCMQHANRLEVQDLPTTTYQEQLTVRVTALTSSWMDPASGWPLPECGSSRTSGIEIWLGGWPCIQKWQR